MNSKQPSMRAKGQRSIHSTFLFRSATNRSNFLKKEPEIRTPNEKGPCISLSEFLNKKLHRCSVLPGSVQRKPKPFSSPGFGEEVLNSAKEEIGKKGNGEVRSAVSTLEEVLEQIKQTNNNVKQNVSSRANDDSNLTDETHKSRKRKPGDFDHHPARKVLAVLGDDSRENCSVGARDANAKKQTPFYNHYANGGGWWDCGMEGVDNDEVGCNEVWEGMGSTTLGGLEWH